MTVKIIIKITEPWIATTTEYLDLIDLITDPARPYVIISYTDNLTELFISNVGMTSSYSCSDLRERSEPSLIDDAIDAFFDWRHIFYLLQNVHPY